MTLIDGDRIVTAQLYDDEYEEFTEQKMSIIDYVNAYTTEGVTTADDVLDKIRAEISNHLQIMDICDIKKVNGVIVQSESVDRKVVLYDSVMQIIDKYREKGEERE